MLTCAKTDVGKVRKKNEDSVFLSDEKVEILDNLYIIADGMGGHNAGEVASSSAIEYFIDYLKTNKVQLDTECTLLDGIFSLNKKIYDRSKNEIEHKGMGTTITLCTIKDNVAYFGHVGDSRAYLISKGEITQITTDHTYVNEMVLKGLMTKEQAIIDPSRNLVTRAIGIGETVMVDYIEKEVSKGDIIVMCSDGLSGMISDEKINDIIQNSSDIESCSTTLINEALQNGGTDNISVILIYV